MTTAEEQEIEMVTDEPTDVEKGAGTYKAGSVISSRRHNDAAMANSVLRFKDVNFVVGKGEKERYILKDVTGKVKWGRE